MLNLLLKQVDDKYIQENFRRIKAYIDSLESGTSTALTTIINNSTPDIWEKLTDTVPAAGSKVIAQSAVGSIRMIKNIVTIYNASMNVNKTFELNIKNINGNVSDTVSHKVGDTIDYTISVSVSGGFVNVTVGNNEAFDLKVNFARVAF